MILRKGYSFPNSDSESMSEFTVFTSFFPTFELFTYPTRRQGSNGPAPIKGSPGIRNTQKIELKYFNN